LIVCFIHIIKNGREKYLTGKKLFNAAIEVELEYIVIILAK